MKVHVTKTPFANAKLDYLGYTINQHGTKPITSKIDAIQNIAPPKTRKQLRSFLRIVNYYRDMWIRRSHILTPLTNLQSKDKPFKWTSIITETCGLDNPMH